MQLALILAVLTTLVISENSPCQPVSGTMVRLVVAGCGMVLAPLFAAVSSGMIAWRLRADFGRRHLLLRRFRDLRRVHVVLWVVMAGATAQWLDWARLVRFNWHLDHAFLIDDMLILTPVVVPLVLSWAAFYEVERAVRAGLAGEGSHELEPTSRRQYLALHLRHYLGLLLLPVLGLLAVQDAAELIAPSLVGSGYGALLYVPALILLFAFFPVLLRHVWQTCPLAAGPLRDRLQSCARRAGFSAREILVWHTGGMMANAAVAGFFPKSRYVFLTDGLLSSLTDEETEAVFGHEAGHVRHHHLLLRVAAMIAPLSLWLLLRQLFPEAMGCLETWLSKGGPGLQAPTGLAVLAGMALYVLVVFGSYSRLLESQADLFGCQALGAERSGDPIATFCSALECLTAAAGGDRNRRSWQHASVARRVDFLNQVARDPIHVLRFHQRVRSLGLLMIGIVISPLVHRLLLG